MTDQPAVYAVPTDPDDPEAAALELIVRLPGSPILARRPGGPPGPPVEVLQEFAAALEIAGCFHGMTWNDAKGAAAAILVDAVNRDNAPQFLRHRANLVAARADGMGHDDPDALARAFRIAAEVLEA